MVRLRLDARAYPVTRDTRRRYRFSILAVVVCIALISWGGLVTSIDAGLAVPDWPTSFGSLDPFATGFDDPANPDSRWWHHLPILAEHGHRLLGALVGLFTLVLALWTWLGRGHAWMHRLGLSGLGDARPWMHKLGFAALGLVIIQGILGGLRVIWVSLDLAVVHALTAQLFFALLVAMTLFTSAAWLRAESIPPASAETRRLRWLALVTVAALYAQIILGALLRHTGAGVHLGFATVHITGAFVVLGLVLATTHRVRQHFSTYRLLNRTAWIMLGAVIAQMMLGFLAFTVLLFETRIAERSVVQVILNSAHLVVGALLMASAVCLALLALHHRIAAESSPHEPVALNQPMQPVGS